MTVSIDFDYDSDIVNETNNTNFTAIPCEIQKILGEPVPLSPTAAKTMKYIQLVYYIGGAPISLLLNIYLIAVVAKFRSLQHLSYYLLLQVIVTDLFICLVLFPVRATNILFDGWAFGSHLCPVIGMAIVFGFLCRNFLMLVISIDRLCSVFGPFWYARHRIKIVVPLSVAAWVSSFIMSLIGVPGLLDCYDFQRLTWVCFFGSGCVNKSACDTYRNFAATLSVLCVFASLVLYIPLYIKAKKLSNVVVPVSEIRNPNGDRTSRSKKQKRATVLPSSRHKREKRATVTVLFLFLALFVVIFPSFLFFVIGSSVLERLQVQRPPSAYIIFDIISRSLFSTLAFIDPLTLMRNADVRKVNMKLFEQIKQVLAKSFHRMINHNELK